MPRDLFVFALLVMVLLAGPAQAPAATFELLGRFPNPSHPSSYATAVSADGEVVVGSSRVPTSLGSAPFRWTAAEGMVDFAGLIGADGDFGHAYDVSADGSVVVGDIWYEGGGGRAYRWTDEDGVVILPTPPEWDDYPYKVASGVSADGSVVVGYVGDDYSKRLFRWTEAEGTVDLGPECGLVEGPDISDDGSVIVGNEPGRGAFRWTEPSGRVYVGTPPRRYQLSACRKHVGRRLGDRGQHRVRRARGLVVAGVPLDARGGPRSAVRSAGGCPLL